MKKLLLFLMILSFFSLNGKSQTPLHLTKSGLVVAGHNITDNGSLTLNPLTPYPLPLIQGFNATTIPTDWTTQLVTATGEKISFVATSDYQTTGPQEGTDFVLFNSFYSTGGGAGAEERLISPSVATTGTASVNVQFYWFESGNTSYTNVTEGVQVEWSNDGTTWNNSTFYPRYVSTAPTTGGWVKKVITLPAGAGNIPALFVSFKFHSAYGYNCYMDNLMILATPTCIEPTALTISGITTTTATVSWTAAVPPPANGYDIYYSTSSTPPTSGTTPSGSVAAGVTTFNMTSLVASTSYYVWVRSVCSPSDKSTWAGSATFNTLCGTNALPLSQGFNSTVLPVCWTTQLVTATGEKISFVASASSQTATPQEGTDFVMFNSYSSTGGGSGAEERLITPAIVTTGTASVNVEFYWFESGNTTYTNITEGVQVEWSNNGTTWTNSDFYPRYVSTAPSTGGWVKKTIVLPAGAGNIATLYVSFKFHSAYGYNCYLDNMVVQPTPSCVQPSVLVISGVTASSATISWTAPPTAPANGYDIYYSTSATPPTGGTTPSGSVAAGITTFTMNSLLASTTYYVWVRSVCTPSDKSSWAGPSNFTTACTPVASLPWSENFDAMTTIGNNILPNCWKAESPTLTPWTSANATGNTYNDPCSAPNYIFVNWNPYGSGINKFLITPGFLLTEGVNYTFAFKYAGDGYAGWTADVLYNTAQTGTGATVIGSPFVDPATTTNSVCQDVSNSFVPPISGTYYFMVRISNTITPFDMGFDDFTLTGPPCIAPTALTATNLTTSSADLGWTSTASGWEYQYGLAGYTPTPTGTATSTNPTHITGLTGGTQYNFYVRTICTGNFSSWVGPMTFTTLADVPAVVTIAAAPVGTTTATLNGTVNANGASTTVSFDYGLTAAYTTNVAGIPPTVTGNTTTADHANITSLIPNTTYHFRIKGINTLGTSLGDDMTFTTLALPPTVVTNPATNLTQTTVQLNGTVTANDVTTTVTFQYGTTIAYGNIVSGVPATISGSTATATLANLTGLTPSTLYHFRCVGTSIGGTTNGGDQTFTTPAPIAPTVATVPTLITNLTTATVFGTVNANGASTAVSFDYGLTNAYGYNVPGVPTPVIGNTTTAVSADLTGLIPLTLYHYRVKGINSVGTSNGADMTFTTICAIAGPAGPISGPTTVCQGGSGYVYTVTIPAAVTYVWTVPIGATITSGANTNSITVSYAYNAAPGFMFVYGTAPCGNGAPSQLPIAVNPPATPTVAGPASPCLNSAGNVYTTQAGMTNYVWTVSAGGNITAGGTGTSSTVTVTWTTTGAKTVSVNYSNASGCAGLTAAIQNVTVNPLPVPVITGPTPACTNYPVVYSTDPGMTGYVWTVSAGGTIQGPTNTNSINVTWTTTGSKTVTVNYVNANGCSATVPVVKNVTVNAGASPTITGLNDICVNSGYVNYTTQTGMTGYTWTVSEGGVLNYGIGTNSIFVTWITAGDQWVKVSYTNAGGCSPFTPTQLNVTVNPIPDASGEISGTDILCSGTTDVAYSVDPIAETQTYVWTLPEGATIASGAGTNSITVNFALDAISGDINVYGNNVCGNGTPSPNFAVTVNPAPAIPVVTRVGDLLTSSAPDGNQWYLNGEPIIGAIDPTYTALEDGEYWVVVTIGDCFAESNHVDVTVGIEHLQSSAFRVYPIPNEGLFKVSIVTRSDENFTLNIYNNIGMKIYELQNIHVNGKLEKVIDLRPVSPGIYSVVLQSGKTQLEKKILVTQ